MGVSYYSCGNCEGVYCDVGDYYTCDSCEQGFCVDCGDNVLINKYGIWDEQNDDDYDEHGNLSGESGYLKSCPICSKDAIDYKKLVKWLATKAGTSEDDLWEQYKGSVIDK